MGRWARDEAAVSEIVGALMLVLIVATAASSLALFVSAKQKQAQAQEQLELDRQLERFDVVAVAPSLQAGSSPAAWEIVNFTVSSVHTKTSVLFDLGLNGNRLESYNLTRFNRTSGLWQDSAHIFGEEVVIRPREQFRLRIELPSDLFDDESVLTTDALELDLTTGRLNHFSRVFLPPTAVPLIDLQAVFNATTSGYDHFVLLDGSRSDHPDASARIVRWGWEVDDGVAPEDLIGRVVRAYQCDGASRDLTLTVTDNFGLIATSRIAGYVC